MFIVVHLVKVHRAAISIIYATTLQVSFIIMTFNKLKLIKPRYKTDLLKHNSFVRGIDAWNILPINVRSANTKKKQKNDKLVDAPPKPEVRSLSSIYRWIELVARNFPPETVYLHHFRFLHNI